MYKIKSMPKRCRGFKTNGIEIIATKLLRVANDYKVNLHLNFKPFKCLSMSDKKTLWDCNISLGMFGTVTDEDKYIIIKLPLSFVLKVVPSEYGINSLLNRLRIQLEEV